MCTHDREVDPLCHAAEMEIREPAMIQQPIERRRVWQRPRHLWHLPPWLNDRGRSRKLAARNIFRLLHNFCFGHAQVSVSESLDRASNDVLPTHRLTGIAFSMI